MVEVGAVVEGKVTGITNFGAFVALPDNQVGMVHISEVSTNFVNDIREYLQENQTVKVKVLDVASNGKISLSIKRAMDPPAQQTGDRPRRGGNARPKGAPNVWKGNDARREEPQSFEDMMARFKQISDEKISDLKRASDGGRRGSYSRKK